MSYRPRRLMRSGRERLWAGVAGGMADYFDVDPAIMRIIWVAAAVLTGGLAVPAYIVMWLVMPRDDLATATTPPPPPPSPTSFTPEEEELLRPVTPPPFPGDGPTGVPDPFTAETLRDRAPADPEESGRRRRAAGILLIGIGMLFFANQIGIFHRVPWHLIWPLAIVCVGVFILMKQSNGHRR